MIIVPIVLRMCGMGIYGLGWPSTINNSALTSIILHIMSIFTITGSYTDCTVMLVFNMTVQSQEFGAAATGLGAYRGTMYSAHKFKLCALRSCSLSAQCPFGTDPRMRPRTARNDSKHG